MAPPNTPTFLARIRRQLILGLSLVALLSAILTGLNYADQTSLEARTEAVLSIAQQRLNDPAFTAQVAELNTARLYSAWLDGLTAAGRLGLVVFAILMAVRVFQQLQHQTQTYTQELEKTARANAARANELDALVRAGLSLTSSMELAAVLDNICQSAMQVMHNPRDVSLFLYDGHTLAFGSGWNEYGRLTQAISVPRQTGLTYTVARTGEMYKIADMAQSDFYAATPFRGAIISYPLKFAGRVVGVMNLAYHNPHTITDDELRPLRVLADQAAIAIENARLYAASRDRANELDAIIQASFSLTASLDLNAALSQISESIYAVMPGAGRHVHVFVVEGQTLRFGCGWSAEGARHEPYFAPRPDGVTHQVMTRGEPLIVEDMADHPLFQNTDWRGSIVSLPLKFAGRVVGVLNFSLENPHHFSGNELRLLQLLAD